MIWGKPINQCNSKLCLGFISSVLTLNRRQQPQDNKFPVQKHSKKQNGQRKSIVKDPLSEKVSLKKYQNDLKSPQSSVANSSKSHFSQIDQQKKFQSSKRFVENQGQFDKIGNCLNNNSVVPRIKTRNMMTVSTESSSTLITNLKMDEMETLQRISIQKIVQNTSLNTDKQKISLSSNASTLNVKQSIETTTSFLNKEELMGRQNIIRSGIPSPNRIHSPKVRFSFQSPNKGLQNRFFSNNYESINLPPPTLRKFRNPDSPEKIRKQQASNQEIENLKAPQKLKQFSIIHEQNEANEHSQFIAQNTKQVANVLKQEKIYNLNRQTHKINEIEEKRNQNQTSKQSSIPDFPSNKVLQNKSHEEVKPENLQNLKSLVLPVAQQGSAIQLKNHNQHLMLSCQQLLSEQENPTLKQLQKPLLSQKVFEESFVQHIVKNVQNYERDLMKQRKPYYQPSIVIKLIQNKWKEESYQVSELGSKTQIKTQDFNEMVSEKQSNFDRLNLTKKQDEDYCSISHQGFSKKKQRKFLGIGQEASNSPKSNTETLSNKILIQILAGKNSQHQQNVLQIPQFTTKKETQKINDFSRECSGPQIQSPKMKRIKKIGNYRVTIDSIQDS